MIETNLIVDIVSFIQLFFSSETEVKIFYSFVVVFFALMTTNLIYMIKFSNLLKLKYPSLYKKLIWRDTNGISFPMPYMNEWFKFIWQGRTYKKDVGILVKRIRLFEFAFALLLLTYSLVFGYITSY